MNKQEQLNKMKQLIMDLLVKNWSLDEGTAFALTEKILQIVDDCESKNITGDALEGEPTDLELYKMAKDRYLLDTPERSI